MAERIKALTRLNGERKGIINFISCYNSNHIFNTVSLQKKIVFQLDYSFSSRFTKYLEFFDEISRHLKSLSKKFARNIILLK